MTATPEAASGPAGEPRPPLRLVVVPTPQPPLEDERLPVRLVIPGVAVSRPPHHPGPRPRRAAGRPREAVDSGPAWSRRADLPDAHEAGRRLVTLALDTLAGR